MKKLLLILSIAICGIANAQYTKLYDFEGSPSTGSNPYGDLISDSTYLYGLTHNGSPTDSGLVFKIKHDGTGYSTIQYTGIDFSFGSLISDGTFLYGMTTLGAGIFKIKPNGTGYTNLLNFTGTNGSGPYGTLFYDGSFLYGTTIYGGTNNDGVIFKIKPDGSGDTVLLNFAGTNGKNPHGSLISDGTFLYGMTYSGGTSNAGVIFKIKPDGTGYTVIYNFSGMYGDNPYGSLISDGTFLYGMTYSGGVNNDGVIFKIKLNGTGFNVLFNFSGTTGANPYGSLFFDNNYLYGMTSIGGTNNDGVIFKIKADGTGYSIMLNFSGTNGSNPHGSFNSDGKFLYGMTQSGGAYNNGIVFKLYTLAIDSVSLTMVSCYGGNNGTATVNVSGGLPPYNYLWSTSPVQTTQTATGLASGNYIVTVTDANSMTATANVSIWQKDSIKIIFSTTYSNCDNSGSITTTVTGGTSPYTYHWNTGQTTTHLTGLTTGIFTLTVTDSKGCIGISQATVKSNPMPSREICYVEFDTATSKNNIIWGPTLSAKIDSVHIYKEVLTNFWSLIGSVPESQIHFIDNNSNPFNQSYSYKISLMDTCGIETDSSTTHTTVTLLVSYVQSTNTYGFTWSAYKGLSVAAYYLYGITSTNKDSLIGSVLGNQYFYNYTSPYSGFVKYFIGFNTPTCTGSKTTHLVKSNWVQSETGINELTLDNLISIYPNPVADNLQIETSLQIINIQITDITGRLIGTTKSKNINCGSFARGAYLIKIMTENGIAVKKFMKE